MTNAVRAALLAVLAAGMVAACGGGGGGGGSPPSPPTSPPPPSPPGGGAAPTFTSAAAVSIHENMAGVVYRPVATDPEGATVTYGAAIGGPDAARFVMNPTTREVRFAAQPNFEAPADAGGNNVYDISFTASDGSTTTTLNVAVTVTNVANGFRVRRVTASASAPMMVVGLPDGSGRVVIVERAGRLRVMNPETGAISATPMLDISSQVATSGEKALAGLAFSPNFIVDRTFYIHMNPNSAHTTEIRQYRVQASDLAVADASSANVIMSVPQLAGQDNHKGGFLAFDNSGRLLIGLGDGGGGGDPAGNGQNRNTLLGKILRIDPTTDAYPADDNRDYAIPPNNPFAVSGGSPEIWAMGLRNPFRGNVDVVTGDAFIGDVGQEAVEEIDRLPANGSALINLGWSRREGSQPYNGGADSAEFTLPVAEYFQNTGGSDRQGASVIGGLIYRGPVEDLQAQLIFGDFVSSNLWTAPLANLNIGAVLPAASFVVRNTAFAPDVGTISNITGIGTDNSGNAYITTIGGSIFRIEPLP